MILLPLLMPFLQQEVLEMLSRRPGNLPSAVSCQSWQEGFCIFKLFIAGVIIGLYLLNGIVKHITESSLQSNFLCSCVCLTHNEGQDCLFRINLSANNCLDRLFNQLNVQITSSGSCWNSLFYPANVVKLKDIEATMIQAVNSSKSALKKRIAVNF